mgnify:CR=1 FL=1
MKILSLFSATKEEREKKAAVRVAKALKRGQESLIDKLEERKDKAEETIAKLVEGKISNINTETFNQTYHDAKLELVLVEKEIEIANEVKEELYSDATEEV